MKRTANIAKQSTRYEHFRAAKAADRMRVLRRVARKEITPEQAQAENAIFTRGAKLQILNLAETMTYFRRHQHSRP